MIVSSCRKDPSWDVSVTTPILHTSLGIEDLVADSMLEVNSDSTLSLVFEKLFQSVSADSLVDMPDSILSYNYKMPLGITVPPGTQIFNTTEAKYYDLGGAMLSEVRLRSGKIVVMAANYINETVQIDYRITNSDISGSNFRLIQSVPSYPLTGLVHEGEYEVGGMFIDLRATWHNCNSIVANVRLFVDPAATSNVQVDALDSFNLLFSFKDIVIDYARGSFGTHIFDSEEDVAISEFEELGIDFIDFDGVQMSLLFENYLGADVSFRVDQLTGNGINGEVPLSSDWIGRSINLSRAAETPPRSGIIEPTELLMDFSSDNVDEFIENLPSTIRYSISGKVNPLGDISSGNDFVYYGKGLSAKLRLAIPLKLSMSGLSLVDSVDYSLEQKESYIRDALLKLKVDNGFPLCVNLRFDLFDDLGNQIDSIIPLSSIESAPVDASGKVISPLQSILLIPISEFQVLHLYNTKRIKIRANFDTGGSSGSKVFFMSHYRIEIWLSGVFDYFIDS